MFIYTLATYKPVPDKLVYFGQLQDYNSAIISLKVTDGQSIKIISEQELYAQSLADIDAIVPAPTPMQTIVEKTIKDAIEFGSNLVIEFAAENVLLGITQAGMTSTVRTVTSKVVSALQTGSLYDAIDEVKAIPAEDKDVTFVTDARMLEFVNKIESYLNLPLSTSL